MHRSGEARKGKVVIIGLDGVPYSLLRNYADHDIMPCFKKMMEEGSLHRMYSSLPEVSSVAWTSLMTGRNPGEHGIFGFMELRQGSYDMVFPNFSDLKTPPFWESSGLPSVVLNVPQTYPARPFNGVMTSGFVAPDLKKATYPERAYTYLASIRYRSDVNANLAIENPTAFFRDLSLTFEKREEAIRHFFQHEDWRIFIGTITETDRLHHFFFNDALDENARFHAEFVGFYRELDAFLGEMHRNAQREGAVFLTCSDHGFTPIKSEVYLNQWLVEAGYLDISDRTNGLRSIRETSSAFCLDPSRIYIHLNDKYPRGSVRHAEYYHLTDELALKLTSLSFNGERVVRKVYRKEEIFRGPFAEKGPDLYVLPNYGFDLKGAVSKGIVFGTTHFRGMHTYDDAHLFISLKHDDRSFMIEEIAGMVTGFLGN